MANLAPKDFLEGGRIERRQREELPPICSAGVQAREFSLALEVPGVAGKSKKALCPALRAADPREARFEAATVCASNVVLEEFFKDLVERDALVMARSVGSRASTTNWKPIADPGIPGNAACGRDDGRDSARRR